MSRRYNYSGDNQSIIVNHSRISGDNCRVTGDCNNVSGDNCIVVGDYNNVTGDNCKVTGSHNKVRGDNCIHNGVSVNAVRTNTGRVIMNQGMLVNQGDASMRFMNQGGGQDWTKQQKDGRNQHPKYQSGGIPYTREVKGTTEVIKMGNVTFNNHFCAPEEPQYVEGPLESDLKYDEVVEEGDDRTKPCIICMDNRACCIATPCMHLSFCIQCSRTLCFGQSGEELREQGEVQCPQCRMDVKSIKRTY